jgi:hypothetical protein
VLQLIHQVVDCRTSQNAVVVGRVIAVAHVELLQKRIIPTGPRALTSASMPARRNSVGVAVLPLMGFAAFMVL